MLASFSSATRQLFTVRPGQVVWDLVGRLWALLAIGAWGMFCFAAFRALGFAAFRPLHICPLLGGWFLVYLFTIKPLLKDAPGRIEDHEGGV
jgi:hypothetical protein